MSHWPKTSAEHQTPPPHEQTPSQPSSTAPSYDSASLFQGQRVVVIAHAGENYRLLLTRNNRLILQK